MKSFKKVYKFIAVVLVMLMLSSVLVVTVPADASGGREIVVNNLAGGRSYRLFIPSGYVPGQPLPLVVMLHGCAQNSAEFRDGTRMNQLAEQENFIVLYPEQSTSANSSRCWNWFEPAHQRRGSGEPQIIVDMVRRVQSEFTINNGAIFAAGLSAGGAMSINLGVLYPDVFTANASFAGIAHQAGTSMLNAFGAMSPGNTAVAPATAARNASNQVPASARSTVPTIIFHGTSDFTVVPRASEHIETQMLEYNRIHGATIGNTPEVRNGTANGLSYTVHTFRDANGNRIVEFHRINGLGHAWSGGNGAIAHTDSRGPNASLIAWKFFQEAAGLGGGGPILPTEPPTNPPTNPPVQPTTNPPVQPTNPPTNPPTGPPTNPPTNPPIQYIVVSANVNQHSLAGRIPAAMFNHYFMIHGPMGVFNMYQVVGTNVWTSVRPSG